MRRRVGTQESGVCRYLSIRGPARPYNQATVVAYSGHSCIGAIEVVSAIGAGGPASDRFYFEGELRRGLVPPSPRSGFSETTP